MLFFAPAQTVTGVQHTNCVNVPQRQLVELSSASGSDSNEKTFCEFEPLSEPLKWDQILHIITSNRLHLLRRSKEQQAEYVKYFEEMKKHWAHPVDHVLHSKFDFGKRKVRNSTALQTEDVNELYEASPSLKEVTEVRTKLCKNEFPYYFEENVEHWVLWKLKDGITNQEIQDAKDKLHTISSEQGGGKKLVASAHWVNPPHLKSLPEIDHVHIVCLVSSDK